MPETAPVERIYTSLYRHSVDEKRRIPIPFRWRPEESVEFSVIIWKKYEAGICLRVLPPDQWAKLRASVDDMPDENRNKAVLKRRIGTSSIQTKLDKAGRLTITEEMALAAGITNQAVLAGMINRFEIWSPERYAIVEATDDAVLAQAMEKME